MEFFSIDNLLTLLMLTLLQAVLGFDNLLYISMESKRVGERDQQRVRRLGIAIAIVLRLILLFVLTKAIRYFEGSFLEIGEAWVEGSDTPASPVHKLLAMDEPIAAPAPQ